MPAPKLIFVNRVYWPSEAATAQLLSDLTEGLAAKGHDVHVIASGVGPGSHRGVTIHRTGGGDRHRGILSQLGNYVHFLRHSRAELARLAQPGDVVILKTDPPLLAVALTRAAVSRGVRVVQWIQDIYPEILTEHYGPMLAPLVWPLRVWRNAAWRRSAVCVAVGPDMQPALTAAGIGAAAQRVQPNWAPRELEQAAQAEDVARLRAVWGLEDRFVVAYSGNLGRVHEFETLLDAAARLRDVPQIAFLFVGGGRRLAEVHRVVADRDLRNVHFSPAVARADLAASLAAADLQVVTLRPGFERWVNPSKLAGVLAVGRPALFIGPEQSAIAELLRVEGAGLAARNGDGAQVADSIHRLQKSPNLTAKLAAGARAAFARQFRFADQLDAWDQLLRAVPRR